MKALLLLGILAFTMSAQDFHGVSVSGAAGGPTITNAATNKPLVGYILKRITSNGINPPPIEVMDYARLANGQGLKPGDSVTYNMTNNFTVRGKTKEGLVEKEGDPIGFEILAVVFADGTYYSPEDKVASEAHFQKLSSDLATVRSMARDTQYMGPEERLTALRQHLIVKLPRNINASQDRDSAYNRRNMAARLLSIIEGQGDEAGAAAIARIAALPDLVKGE